MNKKRLEQLKSIAISLPDKPGVYQFYNSENKIIYVGKAKNLKKRVSSYFLKNYDSGKTKILISKINNIKYIVVNSEQDALLLENNLIKKYQPRYNVMMKDDKSFPWICIKNENFPRVFYTRKHIKDGSLYFGPYTSIKMVKVILDFFKQLYKLRTCNYNLSQKNIKQNKFKVCLEYHIGNCKAPCVEKQNEDEYNKAIDEIKNILKGNIYNVTKYLKNLMQKYADKYKFEEANKIKEKIKILENYQSKSTIVNPSINNVDVFSIIDDEKSAYVNFLKVVNGAIIQVHTLEMKKKLDETKEELLPMAITEIRQKLSIDSKEIILPFYPDIKLDYTKIIVPKRGDKKKLLELSERNVKYYRLEKIKQFERINPQKRYDRILNTIKKDLHLNNLPVHIEGFDNSNIQGTNAVASCVVFKNAKPFKKEYRKFNIKTVTGPNDFASMEEIVYRRYKRLIDENKSLPQLIVIDGGKGQLNAAIKSIKKLNLYGKIAIIGIAKRLEEIYFPEDPTPVYLDKNSESLKIIQQIRNEAHRFGITFHRDKRSKSMVKSELDEIKGIGEKTKQKLLEKFKSISKIKQADFNELEEIIGKAKAKLLLGYFQRTC